MGGGPPGGGPGGPGGGPPPGMFGGNGGKKYNLTDDPEKRAIGGTSSGAICAFTVAWQRPDYFRRVISLIGSYTSIGYIPAEIITAYHTIQGFAASASSGDGESDGLMRIIGVILFAITPFWIAFGTANRGEPLRGVLLSVARGLPS